MTFSIEKAIATNQVRGSLLAWDESNTPTTVTADEYSNALTAHILSLPIVNASLSLVTLLESNLEAFVEAHPDHPCSKEGARLLEIIKGPDFSPQNLLEIITLFDFGISIRDGQLITTLNPENGPILEAHRQIRNLLEHPSDIDLSAIPLHLQNLPWMEMGDETLPHGSVILAAIEITPLSATVSNPYNILVLRVTNRDNLSISFTLDGKETGLSVEDVSYYVHL